MGNEAAGLHSEGEILRRCVIPFFEYLLFRQTIEGVVDLHRIEASAIMIEPVGRLHPCGVKYASCPVFIVPPTCPYKAAGRHAAVPRLGLAGEIARRIASPFFEFIPWK